MKLLGWMHRKLRQNYNEPTKNFTIGNPSTCFSGQVFFDGNKYHMETAHTYSRSGHPNKAETVFQEESSEPFAFLAIGTFGSELMDTDPPTPTFFMPFETVTTNEQMEIEENYPKLINYELEKFLEAEAEEIGDDSPKRSSLASIITICNEGIEGADSEAYANAVAFPLQNSLLGSSIHELAWIRVEPDKEKASFEEGFKKNKIVDDDPKGKSEGSEKRAKGNYLKHFIKMMMKKLHSTSKDSSVSSIDATKSTSLKKKLPKGLKIFHKKVHPEGLITEKQFKLENDMAKNISREHEGGHQIEKDNGKRSSQRANIKQHEQNAMKLSSNGLSKGASMVNREHWIRTDTEYLVLEL
ncbi:Hypothetical predicted protein [Olea europaea subsp. europaea]|uniref:Protein LAZY 1-like n=1 Tax=Olea europaea subsp. europaea TaxID=158383 RepID=A0A8S0PU99_OLEEU|nr:Hypothetical predicted protein [Olea europaea subsp. europaea]